MKKNIKDNFIFIEKYFDKINIVNSKFNQIMNNIEEYKNNLYGVNKILGRRNTYYKNNNIENMLNNTFNIENFVNPLNSVDYNNNSNKNFFV